MTRRAKITVAVDSGPTSSDQIVGLADLGARSHHFGFDSGGQSGPATIGFPPLCTVGAAELEPPALGKIALFPIAIEVFSSALAGAPERVVQLVAGFSPAGVIDSAAKDTVDDQLKRHADIRRKIVFVITEDLVCV